MYAQITHIRVPMGSMAQVRKVITDSYLPAVRMRPGFVSAMFLEQIDDPDSARLIITWQDQASVEAFNSTGALMSSVQSLSATLPGVKVQREGYVVTIRDEVALA